MERYPERLHVRLSAEDKERAQEVAAGLGMSLSGLVRAMARLAAADPDGTRGSIAAQTPIALDRGRSSASPAS